MTKKVILAIVSSENADSVTNTLVAHQYLVTRISSMGGFLRRGNVTLIVGVDEGSLESVLEVIRLAADSEPRPDEHRVTLFVLKAAQFEQI